MTEPAAAGGSGMTKEARVRFGIAVSLVILVAAAVRWPFSFGFGFDDDEFYTLRNALEYFDEPTPAAVRAYPLTFLAARVGLEFLGFETFALRWLAQLLGLLSVWMLYRVGRRFVGPSSALAAAALLALWPWHQYFSGMARYYAPLFFAGIGILASAWELLARPTPARAAVLAAWLGFGVLVHPSAAFGVVGLGAVFLDPRLRGRSGVKWLLSGAVAAAAIGFALHATGAWHNIERVLSQEGGDGANAVQLVFNVGFNVTPLLVALAAIGFVAVHRRNRALARFLAIGCALPLAILAVLAAAGFGVQGRYAMSGLPALLWLAGAGAASIVRLATSRAQAAAAGAACTLALLPGVFSNWIDGDRQPMAAAAEFVRERMDADTWVYAESHGLLSLRLFGFERERPAGIGDPEAPRALAECPPSASELAAIDADGGRTLFVVRAHDLLARSGNAGAFADWLRQNARIVERFGARRFDYHRNELVVLERPARPGARR